MPTTTAGVSASTATTNAALATGSFTPASADLLVAIAVTTGQGSGGTFTDSLGLGWTTIATVLFNTSADSLVIAVANRFVQAAAMTVTFTPAGSPADSGVAISVLRVAGMQLAGISAVRQFATSANGSAAGTPAPVFTNPTMVGHTVIGAVGNRTNPATMTPPASWTEIHDIGYATAVAGLESAAIDGTFAGPTVTWGSASATAFGAVAIELEIPGGTTGGGSGYSADASSIPVPSVPAFVKSLRNNRRHPLGR